MKKNRFSSLFSLKLLHLYLQIKTFVWILNQTIWFRGKNSHQNLFLNKQLMWFYTLFYFRANQSLPIYYLIYLILTKLWPYRGGGGKLTISLYLKTKILPNFNLLTNKTNKNKLKGFHTSLFEMLLILIKPRWKNNNPKIIYI